MRYKYRPEEGLWSEEKGQEGPQWGSRLGRLRGSSLTTLADVHAKEGELGTLSTDAVEVLAVQLGRPLLLPQLHPANVAAAVEEVLLQPPVGKRTGEGTS